MSKYFQTGLVLAYILLTSFLIIWTLSLCGLHISAAIATGSVTAWGLFCFLSFYFQTELLPFSQLNVRKPVYAEEEKLRNYLKEIMKIAHCDKPFRVLIEEKMDFDVFATGPDTIIIARGMLDQFSEGEIKAVLAHELGHLVSKDCMVSSAFLMANKLPRLVGFINKKIFRKAFLALPFSRGRIHAATCFVLFILTGYALYINHQLFSALIVILCLFQFGRLEPVFVFFWLMISRYTEYKQDAFAHQLGYGRELQQALYKLTKDSVQPVNLYHIMVKSTHPVIYNRIRRLEKLEGLR